MMHCEPAPITVEERLRLNEVTALEYCHCLIRASKVGLDISPNHIQIIISKLEKENHEERS